MLTDPAAPRVSLRLASVSEVSLDCEEALRQSRVGGKTDAWAAPVCTANLAFAPWARLLVFQITILHQLFAKPAACWYSFGTQQG